MMRIEFYDANGVKTVVDSVETEDYWEACEIGYTRLLDGGYDDFQVFPPDGWEDH